MKNKLLHGLFVLCFLLALVSCVEANEFGSGEDDYRKKEVDEVSSLSVHFIDVGQGDCSLLCYQDEYLLIDDGTIESSKDVTEYLKKQGVRDLTLVLTHPDADHIGGTLNILSEFDIKEIYMSDYRKDNDLTKAIEEKVESLGVETKTPRTGDEFMLGDARVTFLVPKGDFDTPNNSSIGLKVTYGKNTFLFTGDIEEEAEKALLNEDVFADVYHVNHHGSKTSSSEEFLNKISPLYAVISCGENNDYHHPHAGTLNLLRRMSVRVFRTDEQGTVIATSDGRSITWNCSPSEAWKAGE